jgi:1L-myo-inositol 1-phosphate cytidylyltransferase / CDP-L-myo-inositol myo-inositolphosphotransferase
VNAIVLAAGNGDRFHNRTRDSKLLHPFLGQPLLLRTIETARDAGVETITVVLGYQADRVRALVEEAALPDVKISFALNPDWRLENGISVLAARASIDAERFAILMGDHLFEPAVLRRLLQFSMGRDESVLAVDARPVAPAVAAEATKVRREDSRIVAIGKDLVEYDAIDTGMFVCSPLLFDALETSRAQGDTTLSGGIRQLAGRGLMRAAEVGDATWCDIDTVSDLEAAESALGATSERA